GGAGRDLDQVHALGFPVFTSGAVCAHGYCHFPSIGAPVTVGGITIRPSDLLHADRNGVTTIPIEIADEVAVSCAEFVEAEAAILDYLRAGAPTREGLAAARHESAARIEALRRRVARDR
ncbi:MAG: RraA family protein, partial [Armatimonadetes bacterium]|nr:RraA family protein [Armatimonadota bacterium]